MRLAALLLLGALAASAAPERCMFTAQQPRFASMRTSVTATHVAPQSAFFLSDSLLRTLTRQLGLAECQVRPGTIQGGAAAGSRTHPPLLRPHNRAACPAVP